jgi:hypothetical protein
MFGTTAELDFMLEDAGVAGVFSRGAATLASTYGLLDKKQIIGQADGGYVELGNDITVAVRDGTQGTATLEDVVTIAGIAYRLRNLGVAQADGLRVLTLAGG